ncbi:MAG: OmpA family protein [Candidatus Hydrogenedentota bacterium]|nr:MAG: OmpA family protein [Candidatus Hydrogenedentota bacterium]
MMRRKNLITLGITCLLAITSTYCGGGKNVKKASNPADAKKMAEEESASVKSRAVSGLDDIASKAQAGAVVKAMNAKLSKISLTGFPHNGTKVNVDKYRKWARLSAPVVKEILKKVPPGYIFQIKGHADSKSVNPRRNQQVSYERAKFVRDQLAKEGVDSNKIQIVGVADREPADPNNPESAVNRRVTFSVVKK